MGYFNYTASKPFYTFTLKHDERITIYNMPVGCTYRVEELGTSGYTVTVDGEQATSKEFKLEQSDPEKTLEFKNTRSGSSSSGGHSHYYPTPTPRPGGGDSAQDRRHDDMAEHTELLRAHLNKTAAQKGRRKLRPF